MEYLKVILALFGLIGTGYILTELLSIPKSLREIASNLQEINSSLREINKELKESNASNPNKTQSKKDH